MLPGTFNVIPERARMLVECRHVNADTLRGVENALLELAADCAETYGLRCETKRVEHMDAAEMHPDIRGLLERVCVRMGLRHTSLVSYAGHDAQPLSHFTPSGMIFVPSVGGVSHNANEYSRWPDVVAGANLLLQSVVELANTPLARD
jgi:N-carbamoyl-L-amino-acid hydrolase